MATIDELLVGLGFEYDAAGVEKFKNDIAQTANFVSNLAKAAVVAATAITGLVIASTRASDETGKLADEIGETVENVNALQFAQQIAGGTAEGMSNSLRELSLRTSEAARDTGSAVEAFELLGISATDAGGEIKSASVLIQEISGEFQGLNKARQIELADKLGLRDSIRLLQLGPKAIRELTEEAKELGVVTDIDASISADFNDSLTRLWSVSKQISRVLTQFLAPVLDGMAVGFTNWWKANRKLIEQNVPDWIDNFTKAVKILTLAMAGFIALRIVTHLITLISLMKGVTIATIAMNVAIFLLPALLMSIALAFIALAEDAKVFFEGGKSFIGDMLEKYPQWKDEINVIASAMVTVYDLTLMIFDGWSRIFDLFNDFSVDNVKEAMRNIPGFLSDATGLSTVEGTGFIPETKEKISSIRDKVEEGTKSILNGFRTGLNGVLDMITPPFISLDVSGLTPDLVTAGSSADFQSVIKGLQAPMPIDNRIENTQQTSNTTNVTRLDRLEITINGGGDSAENIANEVYHIFQQTSQNLNSTVDQ